MDEPTSRPDDARDTQVLQHADEATLALIRLLEALPPEARTAFLMHDAFDAGLADLARALGLGETACADLVKAARAHLWRAGPSVV